MNRQRYRVGFIIVVLRNKRSWWRVKENSLINDVDKLVVEFKRSVYKDDESFAILNQKPESFPHFVRSRGDELSVFKFKLFGTYDNITIDNDDDDDNNHKPGHCNRYEARANLNIKALNIVEEFFI